MTTLDLLQNDLGTTLWAQFLEVWRRGWQRGALILLGRSVERQGSAQIAVLFRQHGPGVYRRALRLLGNAADAEEATQEIFIRAFKGQEAFEQRSQLTTWLYQITTNYCLNQLRDRSRRAELKAQHLEAPAASEAKEGADVGSTRSEEAGPARSDDIATVRRLLMDADPQQA